MLIAARESFAAAARKRLPYDAEVEYMQSTGTQYINTGVVPNTATGCSIRFGMFLASSAVPAYVPLGSRTSGGNDRWWINPNSLAGVRQVMFFGRGAAYQQDWSHTVNTMYSATLNFRGDELFTFGTQSASAQGSLTGTWPIWLFGANVSGSLSLSYNGLRLAYCKLSQGSAVVRDYIPVRVGTTGEMYDRISGTFATRVGTFLVGPDKN